MNKHIGFFLFRRWDTVVAKYETAQFVTSMKSKTNQIFGTRKNFRIFYNGKNSVFHISEPYFALRLSPFATYSNRVYGSAILIIIYGMLFTIYCNYHILSIGCFCDITILHRAIPWAIPTPFTASVTLQLWRWMKQDSILTKFDRCQSTNQSKDGSPTWKQFLGARRPKWQRRCKMQWKESPPHITNLKTFLIQLEKVSVKYIFTFSLSNIYFYRIASTKFVWKHEFWSRLCDRR